MNAEFMKIENALNLSCGYFVFYRVYSIRNL